MFNFTCDRSEFAKSMAKVVRAVPTKPSVPVLGNILVAVDEDNGLISLTGFDLSLAIQSNFVADVKEGGAALIPAKLLNDIITLLPDGIVTFGIDADLNATLTAESGVFQLRGLESSEFPDLPTFDENESFMFPRTALLEGLRGVLFAVSPDESRTILRGVNITGSPDKIEFAATDGHRLAVVEIPVTNEQTFELTIPAPALRELERMLSGEKDCTSIYFHVSDDQIAFYLGTSLLVSRTLQGAYPAFRALLPTSFSRQLVLDRKNLLSGLERCSVLSKDFVKASIDPTKEHIELSVESKDFGSAQQIVPLQSAVGESITVGLNIKYLLDGLKAVPSDEVQLNLNESTNPITFSPIGGCNMTYLVMPVHIHS